ncbi:hypothetical protein [Aureliella helgolandensis]|uniref:Uncharacterized protein n=1 Tax=Aureliella helgolandensis TaxID=2527968 RepID=A0A518GG60_9BACT|nr:hypothetical protein [Aureliella helgolandensis]QDV27560.1 hypothetical protein Q31a_59490 [Aureliella helgolandensis]
MSTAIEAPTAIEVSAEFVDRRSRTSSSTGLERRQFGNSHARLSDEARELAEAIDAYKYQHHRRYITFEEMHQVILSLGYHK